MYVVNLELIKNKRKAKHLTLENMAMVLELNSRASYYYKEIGRSPFKDYEIAKVVPLLGISFNDFFIKNRKE